MNYFIVKLLSVHLMYKCIECASATVEHCVKLTWYRGTCILNRAKIKADQTSHGIKSVLGQK